MANITPASIPLFRLTKTVALKSALAVVYLAALLLAGCSEKPEEDPIDHVIDKESHNVHFPGGFAPFIRLPAGATPDQVVATALHIKYFVPAATNFTIVTNRQVTISGNQYNAILADTKIGKKVVLFHPEGTNGDWWTRVYEVKKSP
jgi:hypothetical protein